MERESFEDEATARLMNEHFVPVKVDREERPDLDAIYMDAVQAMTGSGGWPMTVFLTPEGTPFYAGTYFPKEARHGLPAFTRVLEALAEAWRSERDHVSEQGRRVVEAISRGLATRESSELLTEKMLHDAFDALRRSFDPEWGGFGGAPKFPQPMTLEFLLRCHLRGYEGALDMVTVTLDRMAAGGIYDQVGGGFHRYSTDARWHVPHFEKMLYDNAQLLLLYARAHQVTGKEWYSRVAVETGEYLLREMRHPDGGFFSSQDADSEGEEGKFYAWSWGEVVAVVGEAAARGLGALPGGNWEGSNVLGLAAPAEGDVRLDPDMERARARLFEQREGRVRPTTDDKILAAWNGLAISAFAEAGRALREPHFVEAAVRAADFVSERLTSNDGRFLRSWREGTGGGPGYVDDYALMAQGCLTLYETTFDIRYFREAKALADDMIRLFRDEEGGGFFQTGSDAEELVIRPKELFDNAVPSGNSAAASVLLRLALLTGEAPYEQAGLSAQRVVRDLKERAPTAVGHALCALDLYLSPAREVAIVGDPAAGDTRALIAHAHRRFLPNTVLAAGPPGSPAAVEIALLHDRPQLDARATAYVCERFVCKQPVTEPPALGEQLEPALTS
jgi:uncharacterized protein